jgi:zinc protease
VQEELTKFVNEGITAEELADAKKGWQEERKISRAQDKALAASHAALSSANRDILYLEKTDAQIESTTLQEVNAAIRKTFNLAQFLNVYAGDFAAPAKK